MATTKDIQLIDHLLERTLAGQIDWQPTANQNQFTASFKGKYSLSVHQAPESYNCWLTMDDADGRRMHRITDHEYSRVDELYDAARRRAYKVDEAIDDILGAIGGEAERN